MLYSSYSVLPQPYGAERKLQAHQSGLGPGIIVVVCLMYDRSLRRDRGSISYGAGGPGFAKVAEAHYATHPFQAILPLVTMT